VDRTERCDVDTLSKPQDAPGVMEFPISGVFAALITPIDAIGNPDLMAFDRVLEFVMERGVDGVVIGGGTAEYPHFEVNDRTALAAHAVRRMAGRGRVITCVGTSSAFSTLRLARSAADSGSDALLLPMPHFFQYEQEDLTAYCEVVCGSVSMPFLLYNLPSFTNEIKPSTVAHLIETVPNLVGMKDSSGHPGNLEPIGRMRRNANFSILVGDDDLLLSALRAGWDGVVSGIACFVPELIVAVYRSYRSGNETQSSAYQATLDTVISEVVRLPIPWGVRVGLRARGISNGLMHLPLSPGRMRQMEELCGWLENWATERGLNLNQVWAHIP
jgi:4-hydroxy-tetrahydrodipicolinate synthase